MEGIHQFETAEQMASNMPPVPPAPAPAGNPLSTEPKKPRSFKLVGIIIAIVVVLIFGTTATLAALIAYDKISIGSPEFQSKVETIVQDLPFTPKTAKYLIFKAINNKQMYKTAYIDLSSVVDLSGLGPEYAAMMMGNSRLDASVKGPVDFRDEENMKTELEISLTKMFNGNLIVTEDKIYFKVNEIPPTISEMAALEDGVDINQYMNQWISYDLSDLGTEAGAFLDENAEEDSESLTEEQMKFIENFFESSLAKKIQTQSVEIDGVAANEFTLELNSEDMKELASLMRESNPELYADSVLVDEDAPQDLISDVKIVWTIDKANSYTRKMAISFKANLGNIAGPTTGVLGTNNIIPLVDLKDIANDEQSAEVAIVMKASRFDEDFKIEAPANSKTFEQVYLEYMRALQMQADAEQFGLQEPEDSFGIE